MSMQQRAEARIEERAWDIRLVWRRDPRDRRLPGLLDEQVRDAAALNGGNAVCQAIRHAGLGSPRETAVRAEQIDRLRRLEADGIPLDGARPLARPDIR